MSYVDEVREYDRFYPVVKVVGDDTVQREVRDAGPAKDGGRLYFWGEILKGTYADFVRWKRDVHDAGRARTGDILDDMRRHGCPGRTVSDLRLNPKPTKALEAARDFMGADRRDVCFLLLLGPPGVGKSVAAGHVMLEHGRKVGINRAADAPPAYAWIQASQLVSASNYGPDAEWVAGLQRARLLVVDELGADAASRAAKARVTELLLARYAAQRPTVLTGNLSHQDVAEVYGQALVDRIRESGIDPELKAEKSLRVRRTP